ncbi:hypothetical protein FACS1894184_13930 [Clostridia bacterium]|nr:hypothetical protein FACS1894184_13930 [Clostridia bacterium]
MYTANINVRTDAVLKEKAQALLSTLGLDMTTAINIFLNQLVIRNAIPFLVGMPSTSPKSRQLGGMEGKIWVADDFDAPLEDFKEYME